MTLITGEVTSKDKAATWALDRLPAQHRPLLNLARLAYLGKAGDAWEEQREQVNDLGVEMSQQIAACRPRERTPPRSE